VNTLETGRGKPRDRRPIVLHVEVAWDRFTDREIKETGRAVTGRPFATAARRPARR